MSFAFFKLDFSFIAFSIYIKLPRGVLKIPPNKFMRCMYVKYELRFASTVLDMINFSSHSSSFLTPISSGLPREYGIDHV